MRTILVTGGAGFIGSAFLRYMTLRYPGECFLCADNLSYAANYAAIEPLVRAGRVQFFKADICSAEQMEPIYRIWRPQITVHFAAQSHVDRSIKDPAIFLRTNVLGTGVLLDLCRAYGSERFHYVSTDEVYGPAPRGTKFSETAPLHPSSPYAASKAAGDLLVLSYARTYGLGVTISRCANNYGPYQYPEKLIPYMIGRALRGESLPLYGDGSAERDWLYVLDHCVAIDLILQRGAAGEIYNIGAGQQKSNRAVLEALLPLVGAEESRICFVADRPGHDDRYAVDTAKIERLGWRAQTAFSEGLQKTAKWYLEHSFFCSGVKREQDEK